MSSEAAIPHSPRDDNRGLHTLHPKCQNVLDLQRLVGKEGLTIAPADKRSVVSILRLDQRVEVLASRKDLSCRLDSIELAAVALDGRQFSRKLRGDIYDESRFDRVFPVRQSIEQLVRAMRGPAATVAGQASKVAGITPQLGCNPVIRVPAHGEGKDDDTWSEVSYLLHYSLPGFIRVVKVGVGQTGVPPLGNAEDLGGPFGLFGTKLGAASGAGFSGSEIEDTCPMAGIRGLKQRAGAGELDVIAVGGDSENIDGHGGNKA